MSETRPLVVRATFTLAAAARELEVSRTTLYKLIKDGSLKLVHIGHIRRVPREELDRLKRVS